MVSVFVFGAVGYHMGLYVSFFVWAITLSTVMAATASATGTWHRVSLAVGMAGRPFSLTEGR